MDGHNQQFRKTSAVMKKCYFIDMTCSLRIIRDEPRDATFNMAADLLLLERAAMDGALTLRLYSWNPPAVSLGTMQKELPYLDKEALARDNVALVTRPTGGRAVLHAGDLTYACVFPRTLGELGNTIAETYAVIGRCLCRCLALAGINAEMHDSSDDYQATKRNAALPCFLAPNRDEIVAGGRKLVGSAQKRTTSAVLQHGSIPIDGSFRRLPNYMTVDATEKARLAGLLEQKCVCAREIVPNLDKKILGECLVRGFAETLGMAAIERPWTEGELFALTKLG
jgi:lipoyl(octanoyl) transferase